MEQHSTRPAQYGPRRDRPARPPKPPLPPQAGRAPGGGVARSARPDRRGPAPVRRPAPSAAARRLPNPRLTGLGGGLFCGLVMLTLGSLVALLFGASQVVYGVLFLPACVLTALWVREGDLLTAPVVVPIAFALGLVPVADEGDGGIGGRLMGMVTGLATQAGWLYGGTLVAGVIVLGRRMRMIRTINRRTAAARDRDRA
ncbi:MULTISPECIES: DUF6542 domain-containing protein [unclassified Streptomyces]|uniref:DUF6542 domain-containing protein n=2 Tax=Streptomyces TaxID=1883 RepID=UPI0005A75ECF|nr:MULTISPECIES: DUF6542 domain-containing protein [unclassified Streptomyces]ODA74619.1 hypothetical protein APS67_001281 [Streptomyces sp. AVP053U2]